MSEQDFNVASMMANRELPGDVPELLGELTKIHDEMELEAKQFIAENALHKHKIQSLTARIEQAERERDIYKRAVEHYADIGNWSISGDTYHADAIGYDLAQAAIREAEKTD